MIKMIVHVRHGVVKRESAHNATMMQQIAPWNAVVVKKMIPISPTIIVPNNTDILKTLGIFLIMTLQELHVKINN